MAQLAGEAASLTEAEVRAHFSAEFFTFWADQRPPESIVALFRQTIAERGTFTFVGFSYPPRAREALALVQTAAGERAVVAIGVSAGRPALIEFLDVDEAPPTIVPKGRFSGWFDFSGAFTRGANSSGYP